jgi:hypothetical protein
MGEMVEDIRGAQPEQHWSQFERSWTALLSYRYLGKRTPVLDLGVERETMPLRHDMRNAAGGVMAAPLCIAAPEPYWLDTECVPAPVVMSYEIVDPARDVSEVEVLREVIHLGRTMGFSRSRIVDANDSSRLIAISTGTGVSLGAAPEDYEQVDNPPIDVEDSPDLPPLHAVFGAQRDPNGAWRLPELRPEHASPHAALHLGPINIVLEAVAMERVADAAGTDELQVLSWTVMMVRPGVVGPFRASGEVLGTGAGPRLPVQLTLHDEGKDDRVIATAAAVFER